MENFQDTIQLLIKKTELEGGNYSGIVKSTMDVG